jgi:hypothetical protein
LNADQSIRADIAGEKRRRRAAPIDGSWTRRNLKPVSLVTAFDGAGSH